MSSVELFSVCRRELEAGRRVVRAVILKTWGSTPREPGADLVVEVGGALHGTVGGGCGEAEVYEVARELLDSSGNRLGVLLHVDLTENPEEGGDKVCGGRFDVLVQLLVPELHAALVSDLLNALGDHKSILLTTHLGGARPGFWKQGLQRLDFEPLLELSLDTQAVEPAVSEGEFATFSEPIGCLQTLVIVGAGHIARPLCAMAALAGYRVFVLDDRGEYAKSEFFPAATRVVCGAYESILPKLIEGRFVSVVLVTRGHKHDQDCLRLVADSALDYLGMIGSQRRVEAVFRDLVAEGVKPSRLAQVRAPIGLEIGARTPSEIAVAILAEMILFRRKGREAGSAPQLRRRHVRAVELG